jgi:hypothetical protein
MNVVTASGQRFDNVVAQIGGPSVTVLSSGAAVATPTPVAPTTVAPTTVAPTTVAPTTVAPTTVAPTTVAPKTVASTTVAPTTVAPTTVASSCRFSVQFGGLTTGRLGLTACEPIKTVSYQFVFADGSADKEMRSGSVGANGATLDGIQQMRPDYSCGTQIPKSGYGFNEPKTCLVWVVPSRNGRQAMQVRMNVVTASGQRFDNVVAQIGGPSVTVLSSGAAVATPTPVGTTTVAPAMTIAPTCRIRASIVGLYGDTVNVTACARIVQPVTYQFVFADGSTDGAMRGGNVDLSGSATLFGVTEVKRDLRCGTDRNPSRPWITQPKTCPIQSIPSRNGRQANQVRLSIGLLDGTRLNNVLVPIGGEVTVPRK